MDDSTTTLLDFGFISIIFIKLVIFEIAEAALLMAIFYQLDSKI